VTSMPPTSIWAVPVGDNQPCQNLHFSCGQAPGSSPYLQGRMCAGAIKSPNGRSGVSKSADVPVSSRFWVAAGTLCASVAGGLSGSLSAPLGSFVALQNQGWMCKARHAAPHVHAPGRSQCKWPNRTSAVVRAVRAVCVC
jgi:hypothetical protein